MTLHHHSNPTHLLRKKVLCWATESRGLLWTVPTSGLPSWGENETA